MRADWILTAELMDGRPSKEILRKCTQWATKTVKQCPTVRENRRKKEETQRRKSQLVTLRSRLQEDPTNVNVQTRLQELLDIINDQEEKQAIIEQQRLHATWIKDGDKCLRLFFKTCPSKPDHKPTALKLYWMLRAILLQQPDKYWQGQLNTSKEFLMRIDIRPRVKGQLMIGSGSWIRCRVESHKSIEHS